MPKRKAKHNKTIRKSKVSAISKPVSRRKSYLLGFFLGLIMILIASVGLIILSVTSELKPQDNSTFGSKVCYNKNFILPLIHDIDAQGWYAEYENTINFLGYPIYSDTICLSPMSEEFAYEPLTIDVSLSNIEQISTKAEQMYDEPASIVSSTIFQTKVQPTATIKFELDHKDIFYNYIFTANSINTICDKTDKVLECDLSQLNLKQTKSYDYKLWRVSEKLLDTTPEILLAGNLETTVANTIKSSSIKNNGLIYDYNPKIVITSGKKIFNVEEVVLKKVSTGEKIDFNITQGDTTITIQPKNTLIGDSKYELTIKNVYATDNSYLDKPYVLNFSTAGGPIVTKEDAPWYDFKSGRSITITFDQSIAEGPNAKDHIVLSPNKTHKVSYSGNKITISSISGLGSCETVKVTVKAGLHNKYGYPSKKDYSFSFRTTCARISYIGTSVRGRSIPAYSFGTGSKVIFFYGAIHGSEANTKNLMYAWIYELERNATSIPKDKKIIVVPNANPDGVATNNRFNANGVDLNRNWGSSDWQQGTYLTGGQYFPNGGGSSPFSEPETRAVRNVMTANRPYVTLAYHSKASYAIYNAYGQSSSMARTYASLSRYILINGTASTGFDYSATGSYSAWARENGMAALTIELATKTSSETTRNFPAMWRMVKW